MSLGLFFLVGCEAGYVVTIEAEPGLLADLNAFGVSVAGWNQVNDGGDSSSPDSRCFASEDLPLPVGIHAGDTYEEAAAIRVEVWRAEQLWFVHEELLLFGEGKAEHTLRLSDECATCDGGFCSGLTGCHSTSVIGVFGNTPDDFEDVCLPSGP